MDTQDFRAFWSVIPATVLDDMQLQANAKILYGVLSSLMRREGYCWPSNAQLAAAMHCSEDIIRRWLSSLSEGGHIRVRVEPNRKTGGSIRYIYPALAEPTIVEQDEGYRDKQPGTYRAKKPGVPGQKAQSIYNDGLKKDTKKKKGKENAPSGDVAASLLAKCALYGPSVTEAMGRFLKMRIEIKKPIKSQQSATMLWNKLTNLSGWDEAHMVAMLNLATERQWLSVFPLKDDELPQSQRREVDTGGVRFL